jgi:hypothetical protein
MYKVLAVKALGIPESWVSVSIRVSVKIAVFQFFYGSADFEEGEVLKAIRLYFRYIHPLVYIQGTLFNLRPLTIK